MRWASHQLSGVPAPPDHSSPQQVDESLPSPTFREDDSASPYVAGVKRPPPRMVGTHLQVARSSPSAFRSWPSRLTKLTLPSAQTMKSIPSSWPVDDVHIVPQATTPNHAQSRAAAEADFVRSHPSYATTNVIDALRASDYARLDSGGYTYRDYTGSGVYSISQVNAHLGLLSRIVAGNPHSANLASQTTEALINRARRRVLEYFRASPDEYEVIFTPNATGALN